MKVYVVSLQCKPWPWDSASSAWWWYVTFMVSHSGFTWYPTDFLHSSDILVKCTGLGGATGLLQGSPLLELAWCMAIRRHVELDKWAAPSGWLIPRDSPMQGALFFNATREKLWYTAIQGNLWNTQLLPNLVFLATWRERGYSSAMKN